MINNRLIDLVSKAFKNHPQIAIFWLSYFKTKAAVSADEYFLALQELASISGGQFSAEEAKKLSVQQSFSVSIEDLDFIRQTFEKAKGNVEVIESQLLFPIDGQENKQPTMRFIDVSNSSKYTFDMGKHTPVERLGTFQYIEQPSQVSLQTESFLEIKDQHRGSRLVLVIKAGDTKDLIGQRIEVSGDQMFVKVGENDSNHFRVPNEKKMYNSQFSIIRKDGMFFIRDLGELHNCRLKI